MKTLSFTIYSIIGAVAIMAAFAIIPIITLFFVNTFAELGGSLFYITSTLYSYTIVIMFVSVITSMWAMT